MKVLSGWRDGPASKVVLPCEHKDLESGFQNLLSQFQASKRSCTSTRKRTHRERGWGGGRDRERHRHSCVVLNIKYTCSSRYRSPKSPSGRLCDTEVIHPPEVCPWVPAHPSLRAQHWPGADRALHIKYVATIRERGMTTAARSGLEVCIFPLTQCQSQRPGRALQHLRLLGSGFPFPLPPFLIPGQPLPPSFL